MSSFLMKKWIGNEFDKVVKGKMKDILEIQWFQLFFFPRLLEFTGNDGKVEQDTISGEELVVSKHYIIITKLLSNPSFYFLFLDRREPSSS